MSDANYSILPRVPLWTPKGRALGAALLALKRGKGMTAKKESRQEERRHRRTFRFTDYEDAYLVEQSGVAGVSISEYGRRRIFGGRPLVAHADLMVVRELRRIGGLLKSNFETLRQGKVDPEWRQKQEYALRSLAGLIEKIGTTYRHDRQES